MPKSALLLLTCLAATAACSTSETGHEQDTASSTGTGTSGGDSAGTTSGGASGGTTTGADPWAGDAGVSVTVSTIAGDGAAGSRDGSGGHGGKAQFMGPNGVAVDAAGNIYVADTVGHSIRKIDSSGNVTTLAGGTKAGFADGSGGAGGTALFDFPSGVAVDEQSNALLVSDDGNNRIRKVSLSDGTTSTLAGSSKAGFVDGISGDAEFNLNSFSTLGYSGMCGDGHDHFYVADVTNNAIRTVDITGNVGTLAGTGKAGFADGAGGRSGVAKFNAPGSCAVDSSGNVYVADFVNNRVRKIDLQGNVTTLSGNGTEGHQDGSGGPTGRAELFNPAGIAYDPGSGSLFVPDTFADYIRHIAADGSVTTIAGGTTGWKDGLGQQAQFDAPSGMAVDSQGRLIVVEYFGYDVRLLTFK